MYQTMSLTGRKSRFTFEDLIARAKSNCISLVRPYNAHALVGDMQRVAESEVWKLAKPGEVYDKDQAEDILAEVDYEVRDRVLDH